MKIFVLAPPRVGGMDVLVPLFLEIKHLRPESRIEVIFYEPRAYEDLRKNRFLFDEFSRVVDCVVHLSKHRGPFRSATRRMRPTTLSLSLILSILRMISSPNSILLHSRDMSSRLLRLLHRANRILGGRTLRHPNSMVLNLSKAADSGQGNGGYGDASLCFGPPDLPCMKAGAKGPILSIGYPRLYRSWIERIRAVSRDYLRSELRRHHRPEDENVVSLFAGSTVESVFSALEFEQWLNTAIRSVNRGIKDIFILIKPHPMQDMDHLARVVAETCAPNVGVTHLHAGVLACYSRLIIAHHSGTILDAMSLAAPTIQFQELTPDWMRRHPEGSSYLRLGLLWARNEEELDECIRMALSPEYRAPDLSKALGHRQDLTPFFN